MEKLKDDDFTLCMNCYTLNPRQEKVCEKCGDEIKSREQILSRHIAECLPEIYEDWVVSIFETLIRPSKDLRPGLVPRLKSLSDEFQSNTSWRYNSLIQKKGDISGYLSACEKLNSIAAQAGIKKTIDLFALVRDIKGNQKIESNRFTEQQIDLMKNTIKNNIPDQFSTWVEDIFEALKKEEELSNEKPKTRKAVEIASLFALYPIFDIKKSGDNYSKYLANVKELRDLAKSLGVQSVF